MLKFDWNILWTVINLLFFFLLMKLFLFKPIKKVLNKRQELIDEQLENARATGAEADKKLADYESRIADVETEAQQIINNARDEAKAEYNKIIDKAELDSKQMKADAHKQIERDAELARAAAKDEIASLAMQAAEKVVGKAVDAQTNSDIFDEFLSKGSVE